MFKNVASQLITVFAWDATTNLPKTGDAGNITCKIDKDGGGLNSLGTNTATEVSSGSAAGYYTFAPTQAETNADKLSVFPKSATSNIVVIGVPAVIQTVPASWTIPLVTLVTTTTNLTNAPTAGDLTNAMKDSVTAAVPTAAANATAIRPYFHGQYANVYYVATTGDDSRTGAMPINDAGTGGPYATFGKACSVAVANDLILVGPGTFTESAAVTIPCAVHGAGMLRTTITNSGVDGFTNSFNALANVSISDLSLISSNVNSTTLQIGTSSRAELRNMLVQGTAFGLTVNGTVAAYDCQFNAAIIPDALAPGEVIAVDDAGNGPIYYERCVLSADATGANQSVAYYGNGLDVKLIDCTLIAKGGSDENWGVQNHLSTASTWLIRSQIESSGTAALDINVQAGVVMLTDTAFDPAKTSGNYELCPLPTILDSTGLDATQYTAARGAKLDNLDTNVGSRGTSNYAGGAVASVTAGVSLSSGERTTLSGVIWNTLLSVAATPLSFGKKIADAVFGASITVTPISAIVPNGRVTSQQLTAYQFASYSFLFAFTDSQTPPQPVDLMGAAVKLIVAGVAGINTYVIDGTVSGTDNNNVTFTSTDAHTATVGLYQYVIRNTTNDTVLSVGTLQVIRAADVP